MYPISAKKCKMWYSYKFSVSVTLPQNPWPGLCLWTSLEAHSRLQNINPYTSLSPNLGCLDKRLTLPDFHPTMQKYTAIYTLFLLRLPALLPSPPLLSTPSHSSSAIYWQVLSHSELNGIRVSNDCISPILYSRYLLHDYCTINTHECMRVGYSYRTCQSRHMNVHMMCKTLRVWAVVAPAMELRGSSPSSFYCSPSRIFV